MFKEGMKVVWRCWVTGAHRYKEPAVSLALEVSEV
jgi:hypothetical protein